MDIYIPCTDTTVEASGKVARKPTCERCGCVYRYVMKRSVSVTKRSYIFHAAAEEKAEREAEAGLAKKLRKSADPVPCPTCGWYQRQMIWVVRWYWLKVGFVTSLLMAIAFWLFPMLIAHARDESRKDEMFKHIDEVWMPGEFASVLTLVGGIAIFCFYDPNKHRIRLFKNYTCTMITPGNLSPNTPATAQGLAESQHYLTPEPEPPPRPQYIPPAESSIPAVSKPRFTSAPRTAPRRTTTAPAKQSATPATVSVSCPNCRTTFQVSPALLGRTFKCKRCQSPFTATEDA